LAIASNWKSSPKGWKRRSNWRCCVPKGCDEGSGLLLRTADAGRRIHCIRIPAPPTHVHRLSTAMHGRARNWTPPDGRNCCADRNGLSRPLHCFRRTEISSRSKRHSKARPPRGLYAAPECLILLIKRNAHRSPRGRSGVGGCRAKALQSALNQCRRGGMWSRIRRRVGRWTLRRRRPRLPGLMVR